jgi:hypothetical protein
MSLDGVTSGSGPQGETRIALRFALLAWDAAQEPRPPDWLVASAAEGMARAYAGAGDFAQAREWSAKAERLVDRIADADDREIIAEQLASAPLEA